MKFTEFDFDYELMDSLEAMRFDEATPVQEQTIPVIMEGHDLIACAQTGTGKTAAYLLPVINDIVENNPTGIDTVVLVPTRELAIQIDQQMAGFGYFVPVSSTAIYGGNDSSEWDRQRNSLVTGADIVITTPGRMLQHIAMGYVDFSNVRHLILDEADRMLDMGFFDDIMQVVKMMPSEGRQTLMFSATMPPKIRELAREILHEPVEINIAISKPAEGIKQLAYVLYDAQKPAVVRHILEPRKHGSVIIFSSRKTSVKELARTLQRAHFNVGVIHSDLEQKEREEVLREFKNRNINILVATDIIARGIDIEKIDTVINYDVPRDAEDYVHRIGRTARAQSQGEAFTLVNVDEMFAFGRIEKLIGTVVPKGELPAEVGEGPAYEPNRRTSRFGGKGRGASGSGRSSGNTSRGRGRGKSPRQANAKHSDPSSPSTPSQSAPSSPSTPAPATSSQSASPTASSPAPSASEKKRSHRHRGGRHHRRPNSPNGSNNGAPQSSEA